jgi:hypothetical protein
MMLSNDFPRRKKAKRESEKGRKQKGDIVCARKAWKSGRAGRKPEAILASWVGRPVGRSVHSHAPPVRAAATSPTLAHIDTAGEPATTRITHFPSGESRVIGSSAADSCAILSHGEEAIGNHLLQKRKGQARKPDLRVLIAIGTTKVTSLQRRWCPRSFDRRTTEATHSPRLGRTRGRRDCRRRCWRSSPRDRLCHRR